jgi:hypothetical protein
MINFLLAISLVFSSWTGLLFQPQDPEGDAVRFLQLLAAGQYQEAAQGFDATMSSRMPPKHLQNVREDSLTKYGEFQRMEEIQVQLPPVGRIQAVVG